VAFRGWRSSLRIALLTTDSAASGAAVRRLLASRQLDIAVVAESSPFRSPSGPPTRRTLRALGRSWLLIAPYLLVNFVLPRIAWRSLAAFCRERGIPFLRLGDVNARATIDALKGHGAEALLLYHFDQILTGGTIGEFPSGIANVHPSLLPEHRGPVPTIHLMLLERPRAGVTIHRVTPAIDDGAILAQAEVPLPAGVSATGAARLLHLAALPLLASAVELLRTDALGTPQRPRLPYCGFPTAHMLVRLRRMGRRTVQWRDVLDGIYADS
jgi:methionyl-tRNA formyltransferase